MMKRSKALLVCAAMLLAGSARAEESALKQKPLIIAHYMTWFGTPETSGDWFQWRFNRDFAAPDKHHNPDLVLADGRRDIAAVQYPSIGPYDSTDPDAAEYHILLAKDAGIDGFMVNWYGFESDGGVRKQEDKGFEVLLKAAERLNFKVCINLDDKCMFPPYRSAATREQAVNLAHGTVKKILEKYAVSPAYLRIDGRPVLSNFGWMYALSKNDGLERTSFGTWEWEAILTDLPEKFYFIHDHQWGWSKTIEDAGFLKASDSIFPWVGSKSDRIGFYKESQALLQQGKLKMVCGVANPGFDNTPCQGWGGGLAQIPRRDGMEYREQMEESLQSGAGFIQLVTWNDFTEGSNIEPTEEYGDQYLKINAEFAGRLSGSTGTFGTMLDLPKQIFEARKETRRFEAGRWVPGEAVHTLKSLEENAVRAFLKRDRAGAETFLHAARSLIEAENLMRPRAGKVEVSLSPASNAAFEEEDVPFKVKVRNPCTVPIPFIVDIYPENIPGEWFDSLQKTVWVDAGQEKEVEFMVYVPGDAKMLKGWLTARVRSPYAPVTSNAAYLQVYRSRIRFEIGPMNLVKAGGSQKFFMNIETFRKEDVRVDVKFTAPEGWQVKPAEFTGTLPKDGTLSIPLSLKATSKAALSGELSAEVRVKDSVKVISESVAVLPKKQAVLLEGDINQDGIRDFVLGNDQVETHWTAGIGGRMLALFRRESMKNQLFLDYPRVPRTTGAGWGVWAEYGGVNDQFPGDWPGSVWNIDWEAMVKKRSEGSVAVNFFTRTEDGLLIQKEVSLKAGEAGVNVDYEVENMEGEIRNVFWANHPDLAPGGRADKDSVIAVPSFQEETGKIVEVRQVFSPGRMQKTHYVPGAGWCLGYDRKTREYIGQQFDKDSVDKIGVWEGGNFFTVELLLKRFNIAPSEKKRFSVRYVTGRGSIEKAIQNVQKGGER